MNLPMDKIHDPMNGYGRILFPVRPGRWVGRFEGVGPQYVSDPPKSWQLRGIAGEAK